MDDAKIRTRHCSLHWNAFKDFDVAPSHAEAPLHGVPESSGAHSLQVLRIARARERAELIARDLIEYINSIDYQKYFDAMGRPGSRGGNQEKQFSDFSIRAVDAAQVPPLPSGHHILLLRL